MALAVPVRARFKKSRPCPVCGGGDDMPRGKGIRCSGFLAEDERTAFCTRVDSPHPAGGEPEAWAHRLEGECDCAQAHTDAPRSLGAGPGGLGEIAAEYPYLDAEGIYSYSVFRFVPKNFRQGRRQADGMIAWGLGGQKPVLYRLPQVRAAIAEGRRILVCEGEKDVHAAEEAGEVATTNPMGAGKWRDSYTECLKGAAEVWIVCDADDTGREHGRGIYEALRGKTGTLRLLEPPKHKDLADHLAEGLELDWLVELEPVLAAPELAQTNGQPTDEQLAAPRVLYTFAELHDKHEAEDMTEWIWDQLVAPGYLTRLDGRPKVAGKSTLLFSLCAAIRGGQDFLGLPTRTVKVGYCSEQRWRTLHRKLIEPYGAPDWLCLYHDHQCDLGELCSYLHHEAAEYGIELLIIDTVGKWMRLPAGGRHDPDLMAQQMGYLEQLATACAVVVADYTKKGEAPLGEATLGATEQTGRADILMELVRPDSNHPSVRRLSITGRSDAPETIEYEMDENGILSVCDLSETKESARETQVLHAIRELERTGQPAPSSNQLADALDMRRQYCLDALNNLKRDGVLVRIGNVWATERGA